MTTAMTDRVSDAAHILAELCDQLEGEICNALIFGNTKLAENLNRHMARTKRALALLKSDPRSGDHC